MEALLLNGYCKPSSKHKWMSNPFFFKYRSKLWAAVIAEYCFVATTEIIDKDQFDYLDSKYQNPVDKLLKGCLAAKSSWINTDWLFEELEKVKGEGIDVSINSISVSSEFLYDILFHASDSLQVGTIGKTGAQTVCFCGKNQNWCGAVTQTNNTNPVKNFEFTTVKKCVCPLSTIMISGCKCGGA